MSARFVVTDLPIHSLKLLQRKPIGDERGYLERIFCAEELSELVPGKHILQINHTQTSKQGTVRGMHFQFSPYGETKFVSCLRGEVFDVAVDLRRNSPTFLQWSSEILSAENHKTLVIPEGFAHGFQTLTKDCEMLYLHTAAYCADAEGGLNAQDPRLTIRWPLPIAEQSARDSAHPHLESGYDGIAL